MAFVVAQVKSMSSPAVAGFVDAPKERIVGALLEPVDELGPDDEPLDDALVAAEEPRLEEPVADPEFDAIVFDAVLEPLPADSVPAPADVELDVLVAEPSELIVPPVVDPVDASR